MATFVLVPGGWSPFTPVYERLCRDCIDPHPPTCLQPCDSGDDLPPERLER